MDALKEEVVNNVFTRVKGIDGDGIYGIYDEPPTIGVMAQVDKLRLQLKVKTPSGLRFLEVIVKESY